MQKDDVTRPIESVVTEFYLDGMKVETTGTWTLNLYPSGCRICGVSTFSMPEPGQESLCGLCVYWAKLVESLVYAQRQVSLQRTLVRTLLRQYNH